MHAHKDLIQRTGWGYRFGRENRYRRMKLFNFNSTKKYSDQLQSLFLKIDRLLDSARKLFTQSEKMKQIVATEKSAVQQSSSAAHEISSMVATTSDAAEELSSLAMKSYQAVSSSANALNDLTELISAVNRYSQTLQETVRSGLSEISSVTDTMAEIRNKAKIINEIVFQTKLLSFNASVEAARAGEHGKGFAVVAEEMGNLARASGAAALEIETILNSSVEKTKIQIGSVTKELEKVALETIAAISSVSAKSNEISVSFSQLESYSKNTEEKSRQISNATKEQRIGVEEISKSLQQLEISSDEIDVMAVSANKDSAGLATIVEEITGQFSEIALALGYRLEKIEKTFDFDAAISAHIDWKMKLSKYLQKPDGSLDHNKVCLDNACLLGKWIYCEGKSFAAVNPSLFESVKESHATFHKAAGEIIRLINSGESQKAEEMLGASGQYVSISEKTVTLIKELKHAAESDSKAA